MRFTTHLFSPNNTGSPDYNICGQASSILSMTGTTFIVSISDGTTTQNLLTTSNLAGGLSPVYGTYTFGDLDVNFSNIAVNTGTGSIKLLMDFYKTGTTDPCTWRKLYLTITVEKAGYQSYTNAIQIYGYDIGNDTTLSISGNTDFDIYLINNTNNLDILGKQTKAFSKFAVLRQPFTDNVYFYNLVGTQGTITYTDTTSGDTIGTGNYGLVCVRPDACANNSLSIKQTIKVFDSTCVLKDTCETTQAIDSVVWTPTVTSTSTCPDACTDCVNDISEVIVSTTIDYTNVTSFQLDGVLVFLTEFMDESTIFTLIDYTGAELDTSTSTSSVTYAAWIIDPASYLVPISYRIITPPLGDTTVNIIHKFFSDSDLIVCDEDIKFKTCHWWSVNKGEKCGDYTITNCSADDISVILQKFNSDRTFSDIATITVGASLTETISLQADGMYMLKVPSRDAVDTFEYYSLANFCNVEACWLNYLNNVICNKPTDDCKIEDHYKFNTFLINAHTFFMALNDEFNFSFIYTFIDDDRIDNLYTLDSFITRLTEYCNPSDSPCIPCQSN